MSNDAEVDDADLEDGTYSRVDSDLITVATIRSGKRVASFAVPPDQCLEMISVLLKDLSTFSTQKFGMTIPDEEMINSTVPLPPNCPMRFGVAMDERGEPVALTVAFGVGRLEFPFERSQLAQLGKTLLAASSSPAKRQ